MRVVSRLQVDNFLRGYGLGTELRLSGYEVIIALSAELSFNAPSPHPGLIGDTVLLCFVGWLQICASLSLFPRY